MLVFWCKFDCGKRPSVHLISHTTLTTHKTPTSRFQISNWTLYGYLKFYSLLIHLFWRENRTVIKCYLGSAPGTSFKLYNLLIIHKYSDSINYVAITMHITSDIQIDFRNSNSNNNVHASVARMQNDSWLNLNTYVDSRIGLSCALWLAARKTTSWRKCANCGRAKNAQCSFN